MEESIPTPVQLLIDAYLYVLEPLRSHFYGIYLYGSIAFGAFEELESDIDIIALTHREWTIPELEQLKALHTQLIETHQLARRLEVLYVPLHNLGKLDKEMAPYPAIRHAAFSPAGYGNLNYITWWTVKNNSIRLLGPEASTLSFEITWQDVLETMRDSLDGFWVSKVRRPHLFLHDAGRSHLNSGTECLTETEQLLIARSRKVLRKPFEKLIVIVLLRDLIVLLRDDWFVFAVVTHCRILTTIEEGEIITKSVALKRWQERLPAHWVPLIEEAWRIRHHIEGPSLYRSRLRRALELLAFIKYVRRRAGKVLEDLLRGERSGVDLETAAATSITLLLRREL